jgi:hypothetical protein
MTSMFGTFVPAFLFALAQTEIDSSVTPILNSLTPLNTLVLGTLVLELVFRRRQVWGFYRSCWKLTFGVQWGDEPSRSELLLRHFVIIIRLLCHKC